MGMVWGGDGDGWGRGRGNRSLGGVGKILQVFDRRKALELIVNLGHCRKF